jgi:dolichyl-phosphate beta-glucosyltransferase
VNSSTNDEPYLSVVIPAFNEADRIEQTLDAVGEYLAHKGYPHEIIVVNDGSTDATAVIVKGAEHRWPHLRLLGFDRNQGKGAAVRAGMLRAHGDVRLFMDADNSTSIEQVDALLPFIERGYDVVIGSRTLAGAEIRVPQNLTREVLGSVYRAMAHALVPLPYRDTQNGFKLFSRVAARALFSNLYTSGWSFDVEILARAEGGGFQVREVPV